MELHPLQLLGAFVAACFVLALARIVKPFNAPRQFSLGALFIVMTAVAAVCCLVYVYNQK